METQTINNRLATPKKVYLNRSVSLTRKHASDLFAEACITKQKNRSTLKREDDFVFAMRYGERMER